jgi:hypothetical protein
MNKEGKLKVRVFNSNQSKTLEKNVNDFLSDNHVEVARIDFKVAPGGSTNIYMYSALITYYGE